LAISIPFSNCNHDVAGSFFFFSPASFSPRLPINETIFSIQRALAYRWTGLGVS